MITSRVSVELDVSTSDESVDIEADNTSTITIAIMIDGNVDWELKHTYEMSPQELLTEYSNLLIEFHTEYDGDPCKMREFLKELEDELLSRCR